MPNNSCKLIITCLILGLTLFTGALADSKIYIGNEDNQFIVGIESVAAEADAAAGLEIRTYFAKKGLVINGVEYGSLPGKTIYTATAAGKNKDGAFIKYKHNWIYALEEMTAGSTAANSIEYGAGAGPNILTH
ncbi:MAG: hypothetical protein LBQ83_00290 [Candidatus Margulisbacteria bacterium]|jgi:hypothetical protein|nr:hypothetical protein [Candidatus Margulisiibacteriota bacterium]